MILIRTTILLFCCFFTVSCSHSVNYYTEPENGYLSVEGKSLGKVPAEGLSSSMKSGFGPATYRLIYVDGFERSGLLERSEIDWLILSGALMGPLLCTPLMCGAGVCAANPGWAVALIGGSVTSLGGCQGLMTVASPVTVPLAGFLSGLGFLPMGLLTLGERLPSSVVIPRILAPQTKVEKGMPF